MYGACRLWLMHTIGSIHLYTTLCCPRLFQISTYPKEKVNQMTSSTSVALRYARVKSSLVAWNICHVSKRVNFNDIRSSRMTIVGDSLHSISQQFCWTGTSVSWEAHSFAAYLSFLEEKRSPVLCALVSCCYIYNIVCMEESGQQTTWNLWSNVQLQVSN